MTFPTDQCRERRLVGWLAVINNQTSLMDGEGDIINQVEAYTMAGISRAVLRGSIDRGELRVADNLGSRGSARLYRSDVVKLMAERKWPGLPESQPAAAQTASEPCPRCPSLLAQLERVNAELQRQKDDFGRLKASFDAAFARN
ncbi:hypothetical protein ABZ890_08280 [Streptomyces sp. NPDC046984]|uniref:hypothetical protein n=1 Tax=Streptomyces sp. NPDC046984 TaxID=3155138 RepID=UPI0033E2AD8D